MTQHDIIYDYETYRNIFTAHFLDTLSNQDWFFEISEDRNDWQEFCYFLTDLKRKRIRGVGFNNIQFDNIITDFIYHNNNPTAYQIWEKKNQIFKDGWFKHAVWPNNWIFDQIDLYKIHHFDNKARSTSLKALEFAMLSENIKDLPYDPDLDLSKPQRQNLRVYNKHDNFEARKFYFLSIESIRMREELTAKYNRDFMNHNDTKIGKDYFIMKLEQEGIPCYYYDEKDNRQPCQTKREYIDLSSVVFPYIQFEQPEFNRILNYLKKQVITETKGVFKDLCATVGGFSYDFGVGGIHGSVESQIVRSCDEYAIIDIDVKSYYPNIAIANKLYPQHLGKKFCEIYLDVYNQRKVTDKKSSLNAMLKLALNGVYGDSNNVYSPFYDPAYTMSITVNGQLLLCMLAEQLIKINSLSMIQINTDGLTVKVRRSDEQYVKQICEWWEKFTLLELEQVEYKAMYIRDVNNYIGEFTDGKLKRKGTYAHDREVGKQLKKELPWHKNHSQLVIKKAAEAALVRGEDIETFIRNHDNIMDFMLRVKLPRSSKLVGVVNGVDHPLENIQRYYVSTYGCELIKLMPPVKANPEKIRRIGVCVGWQVCPCNDLNEMRAPINYDYYVQEARKLVDPLLSVA